MENHVLLGQENQKFDCLIHVDPNKPWSNVRKVGDEGPLCLVQDASTQVALHWLAMPGKPQIHKTHTTFTHWSIWGMKNIESLSFTTAGIHETDG